MNHPIGHEMEVTGCSDCPMCGMGYPAGNFCQHPDGQVDMLSRDDKDDLITPDSCPLKLEPLTISINYK